MASTNTDDQYGNENVSLKYLKCFTEGMQEWLELKSKVGDSEIRQCKPQLNREIKGCPKNITPYSLSQRIAEKMKELGINGDPVIEFRAVFRIRGI